MPPGDRYHDVIELASNARTFSCRFCSAAGGMAPAMTTFQDAMNHYITVHGYRVILVGPRTTTDSRGQPQESTVAMLGK